MDYRDFKDEIRTDNVTCPKCKKQGEKWISVNEVRWGSKKGPIIWLECRKCELHFKEYLNNSDIEEGETHTYKTKVYVLKPNENYTPPLDHTYRFTEDNKIKMYHNKGFPVG